MEATVHMTHSSTRLHKPDCKMEVVWVWTTAEWCHWWIIWATASSGEGGASSTVTEQRDRSASGVPEHKCGEVCSGGANGWTPSAKRGSWNHASRAGTATCSAGKGLFSLRFLKCPKHHARGHNATCAGDSNGRLRLLSQVNRIYPRRSQILVVILLNY